MHYQFLFYGGSILSHYSTYSTQETDNLINILTINRNAAIVIDSDKNYRSAPIGKTKKRIIDEFHERNMFSWVTLGYEIEHYIPYEVINSARKYNLEKQCDLYTKFDVYISDKLKNFSSHKIKFAHDIKGYITMENSKSISNGNLKKQVEELYLRIQSWNK